MRHLRRNNWSLNKGNNQKIIEDKSVCVCVLSNSCYWFLLKMMNPNSSLWYFVSALLPEPSGHSDPGQPDGDEVQPCEFSPDRHRILKTTCELSSENFLSCWSDLFCSPSAGSGVVFSCCCWKRFLWGCFRVKAYKWLMTGGFYCEAAIVN